MSKIYKKDAPESAGLGFMVPDLSRIGKFKYLRERAGEESLACFALPSLRPALAAALFVSTGRTTIMVAASSDRAEQMAEVLTGYLSEDKVALFPDWETFPYELMRPNIEAIGRRLYLLDQFKQRPLLGVVSIQTLIQKLPDPKLNVERPLEFAPGKDIDLDQIAGRLIGMGYRRSPLAESRGDFARRGSLIDIYPSWGGDPIRIDLFGSSIESIRSFSPDDQRSLGDIRNAAVYPCQEFLYDDELLEKLRNKGAFVNGEEDFEAEDKIRRFLPAAIPMSSLSGYLPDNSLWLVDEPKSVADEAERFLTQQPELLAETFGGRPPLSANDYYLSVPEVKETLKKACNFEELVSAGPRIVIEASLPPEAAGRIELLKSYLDGYKEQGYSVILAVKDIGEAERLGQLLEQAGRSWADKPELSPGRPAIRVGKIEQGFVIPELKLALLGQGDIFPRHLSPQRLTYVSKKKTLLDFSDLKIGDFLVHESHGIASYQGLNRQTIDGVDREYLILEYAAGDRLYLPTDQLHKISRYIGPDAQLPKITRLGSTEWLRATGRARASVKKLAFDLLSLYAERLKSRGHKFSADSNWQQELESAFPYSETKDQLSAIAAVKKDMESPAPMDRLVCGDVGYGKTEVAIRAAFKVILDSKQVMMLVPTTILAQQHYLTFKERFAPYPVEVEMLSRFRSTAQQRQVVEKIKRGQVDIVVGTHRLLQKDIEFSDLGLVIVDEEQRFGVGHKEQLRVLKKTVDVLTLTATPIPRTLQMSLSGVRDLSIIDTPPEGRHPVLTYVGEYQSGIVDSAIRRELNRGGQVFYLRNRVEKIERVADKLAKLVPEARIIVGHGQMSEHELEKVMLDFLDKKADILICTTIIESGLDIPSANTLIVEEANNLGLAQLYQLRGRVGRAHHQAYAYFTYVPGLALTGTALERLRTIAQFTELGSGFKIALRDLEIRGAGNMLGPEQHGQMSAVGFELYCQMLREAVDELQGKSDISLPETQIDLPVQAFIPADYIQDENLRLDTYRSIAKVRDITELPALRQELIDRFGRLPLPVKNLLKLAELRIAGAKIGIKAVTYRRQRMALKGVAPHLAAKISGKIDKSYQPLYKQGIAELSIKIGIEPEKLVIFLLLLINDIMPNILSELEKKERII